MGLLNHLFGNKRTAKKLVMDDNKRMALWDEHLANHKKREELSKHFNFGKVDQALQDIEATDKVLAQIAALISSELVNITDEEKTDEEILADLRGLKDRYKIQTLSETIASVKQKEKALRKLFHEINKVLRAELHFIRLIRKKPSKEFLLQLFELIFFHEADLYAIFEKRMFHKVNEHIHEYITKIARAIILEEKIEEEMETEEEKFVRIMVKNMKSSSSKRSYKRLAENIFGELADLAEKAHRQFAKDDGKLVLITDFLDDDKVMYKIVKKLRPRYDNTKIKGVILAFRKIYALDQFSD